MKFGFLIDRRKSTGCHACGVACKEEHQVPLGTLAAGENTGGDRWSTALADLQWSPGGQAVQRSDDLAAVKNGHIVFVGDGRVRASIAASWYRQMGFPNVYAVDGGTTAWRTSGRPLTQGKTVEESAGYDEGLQDSLPAGYQEAKNQVDPISAEALKSRLEVTPAPIVFVGTSQEFSQGHIPGGRWVLRSWLEPRVGRWPRTKQPRWW